MKEQNLRVIRREYDDAYLIIDANDVEEFQVCESYGNYGDQLSHYDAGDWSLMNSECNMDIYMKEEGVKIFGETFSDIEYDDTYGRLYATNLEELDLEDREEEINEFLNRYEEENAVYEVMTGINWWNGSNHMTEPINEEDYVDEELEKEILKAYKNAEFEQSSCAGYFDAESDGYSFHYSSYPTWYVAYAE